MWTRGNAQQGWRDKSFPGGSPPAWRWGWPWWMTKEIVGSWTATAHASGLFFCTAGLHATPPVRAGWRARHALLPELSDALYLERLDHEGVSARDDAFLHEAHLRRRHTRLGMYTGSSATSAHNGGIRDRLLGRWPHLAERRHHYDRYVVSEHLPDHW